MTRKQAWRAVFLGGTGLVVGMELWAAFDGSPETEPWTHLIVAYVPAEVTYAAIGVLTGWLGGHFRQAYRKKKENRS